ncbi:MAG: cytochrome c biogenesis protein [marine bacterium B5-7]|nr:MAG: cytochrome c biogenesis protein [marine bacterium B5-7]
MKFIDYYKVLGVSEKAEPADIKKAYRRLARKYHPDVSKEADAENRFKEVNEAYEVLRDAARREEYDQLRRYGARPGGEFRPPPGWHSSGGGFRSNTGGAGFSSSGGSGGFSDFFEAIFGASRGGPRQQGRSQGYGQGFSQGFEFSGFDGASASGPGMDRQGGAANGGDSHHEIEVTLEEAFHGGQRRIGLSDPVTGQTRSLDVRIPKGVTDGQKIRLRGQGSSDARGGAAGDVYLVIKIAPHRLFKVEGHNLKLKLPVSPWEAVLGAEVPVPTLGGTVSLRIPPNSSTGQKLRLKERGLPAATPGDLIVELEIAMPSELNQEGRKLIEKMRDSIPFNPRTELGV